VAPPLDRAARYDKFILMPRTAKVAFSLDRELLAQVERIRVDTGESRSAVIGRALRSLTATAAHRREVERYVAAYCEKPEDPREIRSARRRARRTLSRLPWEDA
jgi:metal-responsive CopG/Arc/MetJ family transcriptional regulator